MSLDPGELDSLRRRLGREPTPTELQIVAAEWSEHCSYKSSKKHLGMLPSGGPRVVSGKGYDSGVLDVGDGYVVTAHIESHNHPSAVEPYGGAATGVGGVIRDILSAGTRPIAILDGLRFGDISRDSHARWLFRNAVRGIADYGNCLGIPTVGGEAEFDGCYKGYAMVDVAAVGFGRRERMIRNRAEPGDMMVVIGGATGRDGIMGSQFASGTLESENRSAVQIPDPFMEKMVMEAVLEARDRGVIHAMKDLGGGGFSCAVSETADALDVGAEMDVRSVHTREDMGPDEVMISESQERMLIVTDSRGLDAIREICARFRVGCSMIGTVRDDGMLRVRSGRSTCAELPVGVVAGPELLDLPSERPAWLDGIEGIPLPEPDGDHTRTLCRMLGAPNIASKEWIYSQYDHEVGIRTVRRPGLDGAVLRLDNGRFLAISMDGSPKHCHINPRQGAIGCFEEACRNVACTGAEPIGMLDHLQFGNPRDPGIFWTFLESIRGLSEYAEYMKVPCVGGKVSLYNETPSGPIKPTPVIAVLGLADMYSPPRRILPGYRIILAGTTRDEMGGSEYAEYVCGVEGGRCPRVDFAESAGNMRGASECARSGKAACVHDCSKGGLAVAVSELCMRDMIGCTVSLDRAGPGVAGPERIMYSESHSRYVLAASRQDAGDVLGILRRHGVTACDIGEFGGSSVQFLRSGSQITDLDTAEARKVWSGSLREAVSGG